MAASRRVHGPVAPPHTSPGPALPRPGCGRWRLRAGALAAGGRGGAAARGSRESCGAGIRDALWELVPFWRPGHLGGASPVSGARPGRRGRAWGAAAGC